MLVDINKPADYMENDKYWKSGKSKSPSDPIIQFFVYGTLIMIGIYIMVYILSKIIIVINEIGGYIYG